MTATVHVCGTTPRDHTLPSTRYGCAEQQQYLLWHLQGNASLWPATGFSFQPCE